MYASRPLDRVQRDARTAVQPAGTQESTFELPGRHLLGRDTLASAGGHDCRGEG